MILEQNLFDTYLFEHRGANQFDTIPLPLLHAVTVWCFGDPDADDKSDIISQKRPTSWTMNLAVYESPDSHSLPDSLVWQDSVPEMGSVMYAQITDVDADSVLELAILDETDAWIRIYENRGDNDYEMTGRLETQWPPVAPPCAFCQTYDLDGDGRPEVATGASNGWLTFYEAVANDSFEPTALCSLEGRDDQCRAIAAGPDIDRDGKPELLAFFVGTDNIGHLMILESPGDDSFHVTWRWDGPSSYFGSEALAVGDLDGDSVPEVVVYNGRTSLVYRCTGNDQYEVVWANPAYYHPYSIFDINADGRNELICRSGYEETTILRYFESGVAEHEAARLRAVEVSPSVLRPGARLNLSGLPPDARVELLDISGRVRASPDLTLGIRDLSLRPGAYFVRITSGSQSITRKILVVE